MSNILKKILVLIANFAILLFANFADETGRNENFSLISGFDPTTLIGREKSFGAEFSEGKFLVLSYHDIPFKIVDDRDEYAVEVKNFISHIEFLKSEGFNFISVDEIIDAAEGRGKLPPKAVLLSFDDAYESFYNNVFPILKIYKIPAMLAVVCKWIEFGGLSEYKKNFMSWEQIREVADSGLVNVASHSFDMHKSVLVHPLGSKAAAYISRIYDTEKKEYETEEEYKLRISQDIKLSSEEIEKRVGKKPICFVWPYGRYNGFTVEEAKREGFKLMFTLDSGLGDISRTDTIPRYMPVPNLTGSEFAQNFRKKFVKYPRYRIVHADIDPLYNSDLEQLEKNIDKFVERIYGIKPHAVYLQAFCDLKGDGNIESVYFPNRVLPVKADIFGRIARALSIRGILVYAWMPALSFRLPDNEKNLRLRVCEFRNGENRVSTSWYERLSPFSEEACKIIEDIYEDLAIYCSFEGIIFQDDAYLNDYEDFHPEAIKEYLKCTDSENFVDFHSLPPDKKKKWTELKTDKLNELLGRVRRKVLYYRPDTVFARTLYAPVLTNPESEEWFCQNYEKTIQNFDFAVIMAYPRMEKKFWESNWLRELVKKASEYQHGLEKTVFKVQAYDWKEEEWISDRVLRKWLRVLSAAGAHHLSYYPDGLFENRPDLDKIREMMSSRDFPFDKPRE